MAAVAIIRAAVVTPAEIQAVTTAATTVMDTLAHTVTATSIVRFTSDRAMSRAKAGVVSATTGVNTTT